jgi:hypothetical protein
LPEEKESKVKGGNAWKSCPSCPDICLTNMCTEKAVNCTGHQNTYYC